MPVQKKKECPSCAMEIDADSKVCPICEYEFPSSGKFRLWIIIVLVIVFVLIEVNMYWHFI